MDEITVYRFILCSIVYFMVAKYIVYGNPLSDCDLYTPRDWRQNEHKTRSSLLNEDYICSMDADFNLLKHKQQSYTRAPSLSV